MQRPDPFRERRPHKQEGGTEVPGFRNPTDTIPGHRLRKDLGQHFLRDERVLDAVMAAAGIAPGMRVLEIGPGPGNLTQRLADAVGAKGEVVAIEADKALAPHLEGKWPNVRLIVADAVQTDLGALGRFDRIVANLPYLISGPITVAFLQLLREPAHRWDRAVLMYQAEFAQRLLASAGDDSYGRLSVHVARWTRATKVRDVAPGAFEPAPKVDSMVVLLEPHAKPPFAVADEALWTAVVDGSFQQRRKQMRNTVPPVVARLGVDKDDAVAALTDLDLLTERPEQVAPARFAELVAALAATRGA
ncbi:MAG: 16S rRNA (adenine(1518)-N(6)/adenine(1519)-N(6))-dimethyltransferase RsmA [Candidatus Thermoplasmatota archaeon]